MPCSKLGPGKSGHRLPPCIGESKVLGHGWGDHGRGQHPLSYAWEQVRAQESLDVGPSFLSLTQASLSLKLLVVFEKENVGPEGGRVLKVLQFHEAAVVQAWT